MFFIFGWNHQKITAHGIVEEHICQNCHNTEYWQLDEIAKYFTLFFIPIFPHDTDYWYHCPTCNYGIKIDWDEFQNYKSITEINAAYLEDKITDEERVKQINSFYKTIDNTDEDNRLVSPINSKLTQSVLDQVEIDKIIYAEITHLGAMGNVGGILFYIIPSETEEFVCYNTSIYNDEEMYLKTEQLLLKHLDTENTNNDNQNFFFNLYQGGMGNLVLINKDANLIVEDNFFIYQTEKHEFQIFSSVYGVFNNVANQLKQPK